MHVCCIRDLCGTYNIILNPSYSRIWSKLLENMQDAGTTMVGALTVIFDARMAPTHTKSIYAEKCEEHDGASRFNGTCAVQKK